MQEAKPAKAEGALSAVLIYTYANIHVYIYTHVFIHIYIHTYMTDWLDYVGFSASGSLSQPNSAANLTNWCPGSFIDQEVNSISQQLAQNRTQAGPPKSGFPQIPF